MRKEFALLLTICLTLVGIGVGLIYWASRIEAKQGEDVSGMLVTHDDKRAVTCWRTRHGISCIPDWMIGEPVELENLGTLPKVSRRRP